MFIIGNGRVITRDAETPYLSEGAVVTDGILIKEVGQTAAMGGKYPDAEFIDARGGVVMPGREFDRPRGENDPQSRIEAKFFVKF